MGRFAHVFLLQRFAFAVFSAVYAFSIRRGARRCQIWPSVARELSLALDILPVVVADCSRPVLPFVVQTDASLEGGGVVYSHDVPGGQPALAAECRRPRPMLGSINHREPPPECAPALSAKFETSLEPRYRGSGAWLCVGVSAASRATLMSVSLRPL